MNSKFLLTAMLAVVLVAGCVQPGEWPWITTPTTFVGGGLVITEFYADNTEVYNNRSNEITMTVTNKGGASVPDGEAVAVLQGSALKDDFSDNLYWTNRGTTTSVYQTMGKTMDPYDPIKDVPADEKTLHWYLTSPEGIDPGTIRNDVFIGRVYYDYSTTVTGNIWIYSEAESDAAKAAGKQLNQNSFSSTSGPVALYITVRPDDVVVSDEDSTFILKVKVVNTGGGAVYAPGTIDYDATTPDLSLDSETELNRIDISITAPSGWSGLSDCQGIDIELLKGEETLTCDVTVPVPSTFVSSQIKVEATYGYWIERTTTVTVSGR